MKYIILFVTSALLLTNCQKTTPPQETLTSVNLPTSLHLTHNDLVLIKNQHPTTFNKVTQGLPLDIQDIKAMYQSGFEINTMIGIIKYTNSQFNLDTKEIIHLQNSGVPFSVINFMIQMQ